MPKMIPQDLGKWASHFRIVSLIRLPAPDGSGVLNRAALYHDQMQFEVGWCSDHVDTRLTRGCLVAIRGLPVNPVSRGQEPVSIERLELLDKPLVSINPFESVPPTWLGDRASIKLAVQLWETLEWPFRHLLNAVLWDSGRFHRFITGPASAADSPARTGSNFRLAVEAAHQAYGLLHGLPDVSTSVIVLAALLTYIGKADDFRRSEGVYVLSERGYWVGGQDTIIEWLAVARTKVVIPEAQYLALVHALVAARGKPDDRQSMEAATLTVAIRLAMHRLAPYGGRMVISRIPNA